MLLHIINLERELFQFVLTLKATEFSRTCAECAFCLHTSMYMQEMELSSLASLGEVKDDPVGRNHGFSINIFTCSSTDTQ